MKKKNLAFQFHLWTILLVLGPCLLIMAIYTIGQIQIAKQTHLDSISRQVDFQKRLIDSWLAKRMMDVRKISQMEDFKVLNFPHMASVLAIMQQGDPDFDSLSFIDRDGYFRFSTLPGGIRFTSTAGQPYFQAALAGNESISDIVIGRNSGQPIINFAAPVIDASGTFQGVVLGSVRTTRIETVLRNSWFGQTGEFLLVDRKGILLAEPRFMDQLIAAGKIDTAAKQNLSLPEIALRSVHLGKTGSAEWINYVGVPVLGAYQPLPERGWTLIGSIAEAEILSPIYQQTGRMAIVAFVLLLLIIPLASRVTRQIHSPLEWLISQAHLLADGKYPRTGAAGLPTSGPLELTALCDTFLQMSQKIEHSVGLLKENELRLQAKVIEIQDMNAALEEEITERQAVQTALNRLNSVLEESVRQRTSELQETNAILEEEIAERQSVQEALIENNERYETLLQQTAEAIAIIDLDTERFLETNTAFTKMFQYEAAETTTKTLTQLHLADSRQMEQSRQILFQTGVLPVEIRRFRRKDGHIIAAERSGSLIRYREQNLAILGYRDITERQKLQEELQSQVKLAGVVQKSLLSPDFEDTAIEVKTLFQPFRLVSGDFLGYRRSPDGSLLHGYVLDVTGHGVAAALYTSAVSMLLNEMMEKPHAWTTETLRGLNRHISNYFPDDSFVALIVFTLDFHKNELFFVSFGINYVLVSTSSNQGLVTAPGIYLGITPSPALESSRIPFQPGDSFYFMSDGLYEILPPEIGHTAHQFDTTVATLEALSKSAKRHDDCSAICLKIK